MTQRQTKSEQIFSISSQVYISKLPQNPPAQTNPNLQPSSQTSRLKSQRTTQLHRNLSQRTRTTTKTAIQNPNPIRKSIGQTKTSQSGQN